MQPGDEIAFGVDAGLQRVGRRRVGRIVTNVVFAVQINLHGGLQFAGEQGGSDA